MIAQNVAEELRTFRPTSQTALKPNKLKTLNNVLIVEDDTSLAHLLWLVLERMAPNVKVDWVTSGEEAKYNLSSGEEDMGECPYDLVIADIFLDGDITGLDIWKICDSHYPETNILVTSSLPTDKFASCLKNEFDCPPYLPKPFTMSECIEMISEFIEQE